jgi:alcohol dehydrogenase class IV
VNVPRLEPFRWQDGERLILFGRGQLDQANQLLGSGYALLTTPRAAEDAPRVVQHAASVHHVGPGRVDELAGDLRPQVRGELLVALGGGRVIVTAKALAAADPPRRVAAIPTTLSGAEMTAIHRHAPGVQSDTPRVRPAVVICDPALAASQPPPAMAQSAANALGHAVEGPVTPLGNPVATLAALEAARLLSAEAFSELADERRDQLALGAILAGYVIGSTGYGLHHVVSQTLVRFAGIGHGAANAIMLPHTIGALQRRSLGAFLDSLSHTLDQDPAELAARLRDLGGPRRLREAGVAEADLDRCAREASGRPELQMTPPPADESELRELYRAAY